MRVIHTLMLFWFGFYSVLLAEAQLSGGTQPFQAPDVQAWLVGDAVHLDPTGAGTFRIAVRVPPDHHGYLDTGDEGLYIPLAFTFAPIEARGGRVVMLSRPEGTRDKQAGATVLRGTGEFVFRLETPSTALPTDRVLPATLRAQICNDITNICYPPRMTDIPLRIAAVPGTTHGAPAQAGNVRAASLTFHGRVTAGLQRAMGNRALAFALVTVVGLLAAATLCVSPLIPASVARLAAHAGGSRRRGCVHAAAYCAGVICLYSLLAVKIYDTDPAFPSWQQDHRFPELRGVGGQPFLPLFAIFSPQGALVWKGQDYQAVQTMVVQLERARRTPFRNPEQTRPFVDETRQR